jgi:hypothetical protein
VDDLSTPEEKEPHHKEKSRIVAALSVELVLK